jgi:hypothetical protein
VLSVPTLTKYREDKKSRLANLGTESTLPIFGLKKKIWIQINLGTDSTLVLSSPT